MGYLTRDPIDVEKWRGGYAGPEVGAWVEFLGIVRKEEQGRPIGVLEYEAYEPMAEAVIGRLIEEAKQRWPFIELTVCHRVGRVPVGGIAVLIGVQAPHREQAFLACRFLIDRIKEEAPIWKKPWMSEHGQVDSVETALRGA